MCKENVNSRPKYFKYGITAWAFVETFLLSGYYSGWASLVYVLKKEGMYSFLCHSTSQGYINTTTSSYVDVTHERNSDFTQEHEVSLNPSPERPLTADGEDFGCSDQDDMFELCVTICSIALTFFSLVMGHTNFVHGIRTTRIVSITLLVLGSAMFAGISKDTPWMMFIGYLALANGGIGILQTNNQVSYMFEKGGPTVIGLICGAFDASGTVMLGVKLAYDNGVSLQMSFIAIGCLNIIAVISTFTFLPKKFVKNAQTNSNSVVDNEAVLSEEAMEKHTSLNNKNEYTEKTVLLRDKSKSQNLHELRSEVSETRQGIASYPTTEERNRVSMEGDISRVKEDKEKSKNSLLLGYIFSPLYMLTVLWGCVIQLIFVLFIGSYNAWLEHITQHVRERVSVFTDFMFTVMLVSPVVSILSGAMVDFFYSIQPETRSHKARTHYALAAPVALTNFLALILCACVVVETEDMTYVTVITSVLYRTLLYSALTLFSRLMYPSEYFAAIYGVLLTISTLVNFLQYPLFLWCQSSPSGYRQVYGMLGLASILVSIQPMYLIYTGYKET